MKGRYAISALMLAASLAIDTGPLAAAEEETVAEPQKDDERPPEVPAIADVGGVLTPAGRLVVEPSLQFTNSQVNRFTFLGVEILDTVLIGVVEAEDVDRDVLTSAIEFRQGITPRFEAALKVPYVYRSERRSVTIPQANSADPTTVERDISNDAVGDLEFSLHYQLTSGHGWPYVIGNLRYKSTTGEGLFDVEFDENAVEQEPATGSGFHGIEPSLTFLYPSDPAVFYANVGYLFNLADDVDKTLGSGDNARRIGRVDPGDSVRLSFGTSFAINPRASLSLGYKHDFIQGTETEINGVDFDGNSLDVGALLVGFSHALGTRTNASLNLEIGATADAPDASLTLRLPFVLGE